MNRSDSSISTWPGARDSQTQAETALRNDAFKESIGFILSKDGVKADGTPATTGGSGFFVDRDGLLATDYHVIKNNRDGLTVRTADGVERRATIKAVDPGHDLALLQVEKKPGETFVPIELAETSMDLQASDRVISRGHPRRSEQSLLSSGTDNVQTTLSRFDLKGGLLPGEDPRRRMISTRMEVDQGDSGSPLIRRGKVIGVVDFTAQEVNRAVSTPVEDLHALIASARRNEPRMAPQFNIADYLGRSPTPYSSMIPQGLGAQDTSPTSLIAKWASVPTLPRKSWCPSC